MKLDRNFYTRDSVTLIARELLGKVIFTLIDRKLTAGIITETEAYAGITDKASHAYNNRRTARNEVMYEEGGAVYVYLCYGIHHLFNIVTNKKNIPDAVLLRGILPIKGIKVMENRSGKKFTDKKIINGPGRTSKALGIRVNHNKESRLGNLIWIEDFGYRPDRKDILTVPRIGVAYAGKDALLPYRFFLSEKAANNIKKSPA
jgi:DNA-3-methyladenine glycosylase